MKWLKMLLISIVTEIVILIMNVLETIIKLGGKMKTVKKFTTYRVFEGRQRDRRLVTREKMYYLRLSDERATEALERGWAYCPKHEWKQTVRDAK